MTTPLTDPLIKITAPFLTKSEDQKEKFEESLQTASRVALSVGEFFVLYRSWIIGWGLYPYIGGASITYPLILLFGKIDSKTAYYAMATFMGQAAFFAAKQPNMRLAVASTLFCFGSCYTFLSAAHKDQSKGYLTGGLDRACTNLAPYFAKFFGAKKS